MASELDDGLGGVYTSSLPTISSLPSAFSSAVWRSVWGS